MNHKRIFFVAVLFVMAILFICGCEDDEPTGKSTLGIEMDRSAFSTADTIEFQISNNTGVAVGVVTTVLPIQVTTEPDREDLSYRIEKQSDDSWIYAFSPIVLGIAYQHQYILDSGDIMEGPGTSAEVVIGNAGPGTFRIVIYYEVKDGINVAPLADCGAESTSQDLRRLCSESFTIE